METLPLRDIHLPDPIGWWPLAPGWWGVLALLALVIGMLVLIGRRRRRLTAIKLALRELSLLEADPELSTREKLMALSGLMRRVAVTVGPREDVAGKVGEDWLCWLNNSVPSVPFDRDYGQLLIHRQYSENPPGESVPELFAMYRKWLLGIKENHNQ